jgi:hypothetical protein
MADNRKFTQLSKANTMDRVRRYVQETRFGRRRCEIVHPVTETSFTFARRHSVLSSFWAGYYGSLFPDCDQRPT